MATVTAILGLCGSGQTYFLNQMIGVERQWGSCSRFPGLATVFYSTCWR